MNTVCILHAYLLLVYTLANAMTWKQFQRIISFDGDLCQDAEVVFSKDNFKEKTICLIECTKYVNCKSIFYVKDTGSCTGCTMVYDIVSKPTGTVNGSIYYGHAECPDGWFSIEDSCYFITGDMYFAEGVETCRSLNAHPVVIETEDENTNLKSKLRLLSTAEPLGALFAGYTDVAMEGNWVVIDTSEPLSINDWGPNEPQGGTAENCFVLYEPYDFQWIDIPCSTAYKTICEK